MIQLSFLLRISIDANSGPLRNVLWCCGGICHQPDTFIQIGYGHAVYKSNLAIAKRPYRMSSWSNWEGVDKRQIFCQIFFLHYPLPTQLVSFQELGSRVDIVKIWRWSYWIGHPA